MPIERKKICKTYLILCEGKDEEQFLIKYLESNTLSADPRFSNDIQVFDFGGNNDLCSYLMNLKNMDKFDKVTSIAIIRDAEKNYEGACREVKSCLGKCGFKSPDSCGTWVNDDSGVRIGFMLFPLNDEPGTLEDLCLRIISEDNGNEILSSIDQFLTSMETTHGRRYRRKHKNQIHSYLASTDKYVTMPIGMASGAGAFDFESPEMEPLKRFLSEGFT